jgi:hypothetical protein
MSAYRGAGALGEPRSSSWRSTYDNNANGGAGSFIYPFANGFVVNDADYPEKTYGARCISLVNWVSTNIWYSCDDHACQVV